LERRREDHKKPTSIRFSPYSLQLKLGEINKHDQGECNKNFLQTQSKIPACRGKQGTKENNLRRTRDRAVRMFCLLPRKSRTGPGQKEWGNLEKKNIIWGLHFTALVAALSTRAQEQWSKNTSGGGEGREGLIHRGSTRSLFNSHR